MTLNLALNKLTGGNDENPMPLVNMVPSKGQDLSFVQDLILKHLTHICQMKSPLHY